MKISMRGWLRTALALLVLAVAHSSYVMADDDTPGAALVSVINAKSTAAPATGESPFVPEGKADVTDMPVAPSEASPVMEGVSSSPCASDCGCGSGFGFGSLFGSGCCDDYAGAPGRFWFQGDYLHWWTRGQNLPPLVSTVTDLTNPTGSLQTVFGNQTVENGGHNGFSMNLGGWINQQHTWGLELNYFDLGQDSENYDSGFSNGFLNGNPFPLVRPFFDPASGVGVNAVAYPNQYVGRVTVDTNDYFQSAGVTLRHSLYSSEWVDGDHDVNWLDSSARSVRVDVLAGYRYMRLSDNITAQDNEMDINAASPTYLNTFNFIDAYSTRNDFNGGEIGLDLTASRGRFSVEMIGKVAMGNNHEFAQLAGFERLDASNVGGGIQQAQAANSYTRNMFSFIPQFTVNGGYNVTNYLKLTAGYDIMCWTHVIRAGDQIATEPTTGLPYGTLVGTPLPAFSFVDNYFWAQGIRLGAEVRY